MRRLTFAVLAFTIAFVVAACASSANPRVTTGSPDRVTSAEIRAASASNAYELVSRLRPQWLRPQAPGSISGPSQVILVYLDGLRLGDINDLRTVSASAIESMQYLDATRAPTVLRDIRNEPIAGAILLVSKP